MSPTFLTRTTRRSVVSTCQPPGQSAISVLRGNLSDLPFILSHVQHNIIINTKEMSSATGADAASVRQDPSSGHPHQRSRGHRNHGESSHGRPAKPFASSAGDSRVVASGAIEEARSGGSDASSGGRWRKRHRWHAGGRGGKVVAAQQGRTASAQRSASAGTTEAGTTANMRASTTSLPKTPQLAPCSAAAVIKREGTVSINRIVRCIDPVGGLSARSLKDMLRLGGNPNTDMVDTPCWGPKPTPADAEAASAANSSPLLAFTLDAIATPNTFAVFHPKKGGGSATATAEDSGAPGSEIGADGPSACNAAPQPTVAVVPVEDDWMPQIAVESAYQYILRNFTAEGSFAFYDTPEARSVFLEKCYMVCQQAATILEKEPLMSCVYAPVYVFGDIHGNFEDLSYFLKSVLAFNDIHLSPCNILCLGDYVDRGPYSLECVMILLALKIEAPHKVTLLRGNHEDRVVCGDRRTYGSDCFLAQCQAIFGPAEGNKLFKAVTGVFRHLPLAAEIVVSHAPNTRVSSEPEVFPDQTPSVSAGFHAESKSLIGSTATQWKRATDQRHRSHVERILCTHGGIPRFNEPPRDRDMLQFLRSPDFPRLLTLFPNNPTVRDDPDASLMDLDEEVLQKAWYVMFDLMWSDPTADDTSSNINEWGFGFNTRGNNVVSFSAKAVDTFLDAFQYSMLFRAHQEKAHGIRLSKSQKVLTIFSSSNYLGHGNGAGCVIVNPQGQIQLIVKSSR